MGDEPVSTAPSPLAGLASAAAGFVDALIAGSLDGHRPAVALVAILAALQISWGMLGVVRAERPIGAAGVVVNLAAVVVWLGAVTSGLSFVDGLDTQRSLDVTTVLALVLSAVAGFAGLARIVEARDEPRPARLRASVLLGVAIGVVGVGALGAIVDSGTSADTPAPDVVVAPTTTVPTGLIGLPTGGGDPDSELTKLVAESGYGDTTVPTTP